MSKIKEFLQYVALTLLIIFLGPPMFTAELITRRTTRWKSLYVLTAWCLLFWSAISALVWAYLSFP